MKKGQLQNDRTRKGQIKKMKLYIPNQIIAKPKIAQPEITQIKQS